MICLNCFDTLTFGPDGWTHADPTTTCPIPEVAWPQAGGASHADDDGEAA